MRCGDRVRVRIDPEKHPEMYPHFPQGEGILGLSYGQTCGGGAIDEHAWTVLFDAHGQHSWYPSDTITVITLGDDAAELAARRRQDRDWHARQARGKELG